MEFVLVPQALYANAFREEKRTNPCEPLLFVIEIENKMWAQDVSQ